MKSLRRLGGGAGQSVARRRWYQLPEASLIVHYSAFPRSRCRTTASQVSRARRPRLSAVNSGRIPILALLLRPLNRCRRSCRSTCRRRRKPSPIRPSFLWQPCRQWGEMATRHCSSCTFWSFHSRYRRRDRVSRRPDRSTRTQVHLVACNAPDIFPFVYKCPCSKKWLQCLPLPLTRPHSGESSASCFRISTTSAFWSKPSALKVLMRFSFISTKSGQLKNVPLFLEVKHRRHISKKKIYCQRMASVFQRGVARLRRAKMTGQLSPGEGVTDDVTVK